MIFYGTITIEWNGLGQPLRSMVFRWFWGLATIGNDGFRWFSTIGPSMEWLPAIVEAYSVLWLTQITSDSPTKIISHVVIPSSKSLLTIALKILKTIELSCGHNYNLDLALL